jgi:hypothetical protein
MAKEEFRAIKSEPHNLLFGQRKEPDGQKLGRASANTGNATEIYKSLVAAEPSARRSNARNQPPPRPPTRHSPAAPVQHRTTRLDRPLDA